jgi:hypothetical protein
MECCVCSEEIEEAAETATEAVVDHFHAEHGLRE